MNRRNLSDDAGDGLAGAGAGLGWPGAMAGYRRYAATLRRPPDAGDGPAELVRHATLAASSHNTQPWRFVVGRERIAILADRSRRTPVVDPDDHHLFVSLGCAAENLAIAGAALGRPGTVEIEPGDGSALAFAFTRRAEGAHPLFAAIPLRQSTRTLYDGKAIPAADLAALEASAAEPGARLHLVSERASVDAIGELIAAGSDTQMNDAAFRRELRQWIRFNPRSAMSHGDGLLSAATGNPSLPEFLGGPALSMFMTARADRARCLRQVASTPALAVFVADEADPAHWMRVGRACQRLQLAATRLGLKSAFLNQPVEVPRLRPELAALVGETGRRPDIVMRLGYGPALPYSPRRPVSAVMAAEPGSERAG